MIILENIVNTLQLKLGNVDNKYKSVLEETVLNIWSQIASLYKWPFLESPDSYPFDLVIDQVLYKMNKVEVGRMLYLANSDAVPLYTFIEKLIFNDLLVGMTNNVNTNFSSLENSIGPSIFTTEGKLGDKHQIRLYGAPKVVSTVYLHYNELGTKNNLSKCPDSAYNALVHGTMSILAAPTEYQTTQKQLRWKALTFKEDELFQFWLGKMVGAELPPVSANPVYTVRNHIGNQLSDIDNIDNY